MISTPELLKTHLNYQTQHIDIDIDGATYGCQCIGLILPGLRSQRLPNERARAVFNTDVLAGSILDCIDNFEDMIAFVNINQTTRRMFQIYHKAALIRALSHYKKSICEIVTSLVISPRGNSEPRLYTWNPLKMSCNPKAYLTPETLEAVTRPVYTLKKMAFLERNVERAVNVLAWPNGKYIPYHYYYRTRPGALFMHCLTPENWDCQRRIEKNLRLAMWQLHLFNEMFHVQVPRWIDSPTECLWAQVDFMSKLAIRELVEMFRLYRSLYRKTKKSKHPRLKLLAEELRIGEHGLKAVKDPIEARVPVLWLKKHLIYQLSIGLPLLLRAFDPPETIKSVRRLDRKERMCNAVRLHLTRRQQRLALWLQDVYKWKRSSIDFLGRIRHEFSDGFILEETI